MSKCEANNIPRACADRFTQIEHRLTRIEDKLDILCARQRTFIDRAWQVFKGAVLLVVGWLLGSKSYSR